MEYPFFSVSSGRSNITLVPDRLAIVVARSFSLMSDAILPKLYASPFLPAISVLSRPDTASATYKYEKYWLPSLFRIISSLLIPLFINKKY